MKSKLNNKYVRWGVTAFSVIAAAIIFYYFMFHRSNIVSGISSLIGILMPVVFGLATAYVMTPILNFVERTLLNPLCTKCRIKETRRRKTIIRGISILITAFLFVALIYMLIYMLISQLIPSIEGLINNFDTYSTNVMNWINRTLENNPDIGEYVTRNIDKYSEQLEEWLQNLLPDTATLIKTVSLSVINVLDVLWDFIVGFIISIYVLASKERFAAQAKKVLYALFTQKTANTIIKNFRFTHRTFVGFLTGKIIDSIIIGILCFISTSIMRLPYALLISVIIGVTNIIPFFGPFLGAIPSIILIFIVDPMHPLNCLYFALFVLALQQFDGNILGPKILGNSTGLTGFWVIFSITLFGGMLGVFGMIVGVPIFAVFYASVRSAINTKLDKKNLPKESAQYETVEYIDENGIHLLSTDAKTLRKKQKTTDTVVEKGTDSVKDDSQTDKEKSK